MPNGRTKGSGRPRLSDEVKAEVIRLGRTGISRNQIVRDSGVSAYSVSKICHEAGITFNRDQAKVAIAARLVDFKVARMAINERLIVEVNRALDDMTGEYVAYNFGGKDNTYEEHRLDQPPVEARLKLMQAVNIALARHLDLDAKDSDGGVDEAKSMLGAIFAGLRSAATELPS